MRNVVELVLGGGCRLRLLHVSLVDFVDLHVNARSVSCTSSTSSKRTPSIDAATRRLDAPAFEHSMIM